MHTVCLLVADLLPNILFNNDLLISFYAFALRMQLRLHFRLFL
ncbi:hypothetical protein BN133_2032 [Cronobacter dublinensis 582]|nr:hypothetical protein BN133_2032 [Cronobacter dublinensis 582]